MQHSTDEDSNKSAIEILRRRGYLVSDKGIVHVIDKPNESSTTLYPWKKIKQIQTYKVGVNNTFINIHFWLSDAAVINIYLENKDDTLIVYKFLADKLLSYGMNTSVK